MKLIKTANGPKTIDDWDINYVPVKLRDILHEHRSTLITNILKGRGVETYLSYKFNRKATKAQIDAIKEQLFVRKHSPLEIDDYPGILEEVLRSEVVALDNEKFFSEIEVIFKRELDMEQDQRPQPWDKPTYNDRDFREFIRKQLVSEIQTEAGLKKYIMENYSSEIANKSKLLYLLDEVREHFKNEPGNFKWLHERFTERRLVDADSGNQYVFDKEMHEILRGHFGY
jgi:hypothetical protein